MAIWAFVCLACVSLYARLELPSQEIKATDHHWRSAVVFRRTDQGWKYFGIVNSPGLNLKQISAGDERQGLEGDYRIFVLRDGGVRRIDFRLSPEAAWEYETPDKIRAYESKEVKRVIKSSRPIDKSVKVAINRKRAISAHAASLESASTLEQLTHNSDVIATGKVISIWRKGYTPLEYVNSLQHTVYLFAVETFIKADKPDRELVLKVRQQGSDLPWRDDNGILRQGMYYEGNPFLQVGDRYILFLRLLRNRFAFPRTPFPMATVDGVSGRAGDWDEWIFVAPERAKLHIKNGAVSAATPGLHWEFEDGRIILGLTEQHAIAMIRQELDLAAKK